MNDNSQKYKCSHDALADIVELVPNPRNPNTHDDLQISMLAKVIRHQGWRSPIVVSKRSGFVVTGHGRLEAAKLLGLAVVPVDHQEFKSEADEWAHMIADNRIAELAEINSADLAALIKDLPSDIDVELTGFFQKQIDALSALDADLETEWDKSGLPEYNGEPKGEGGTIIVHFLSKKSKSIFAKSLNVQISESAKYVWFPNKPDEK
jgi:hypothetical protein